MKIIHHATPMGAAMSEGDLKNFLSTSQINIQIGTVDSKGDPSIQPVWYYYDQNADRLYVNTGKDSLKVRNIMRKSTV
jgi:general stress protein 26